jgi:hypothetical protein
VDEQNAASLAARRASTQRLLTYIALLVAHDEANLLCAIDRRSCLRVRHVAPWTSSSQSRSSTRVTPDSKSVVRALASMAEQADGVRARRVDSTRDARRVWRTLLGTGPDGDCCARSTTVRSQ